MAWAQSYANHVQHIKRLSRATSRVTRHVARLNSSDIKLTELKSHLFELYFIGWTTNQWRRGGNWSTQRKPLATSFMITTHLTARPLAWWLSEVIDMSKTPRKNWDSVGHVQAFLSHWDYQIQKWAKWTNHAGCNWLLAYLIDRSAKTIVYVAIQKSKLQIKLAFNPVAVYWHQANQSQHCPYNTRRLGRVATERPILSPWYDMTAEERSGIWTQACS